MAKFSSTSSVKPGGGNGLNTATKPAQSSAPIQPTTAAGPAQPGPDQIRRKAFEIYQSRVAQGRPGDAPSDWQQAERELKSR